MSSPLILAVVGHTNVGKTSLLRTLTYDSNFGEISDRPGTTRHVEGARLRVNGQSVVELYDTPGLEDAISLRDYLDTIARPEDRLDGPTKINRFLSSTEAKELFEQEAKVLRQLLKSHAGLYVVDVREPVLPKYRDELAILADCGKPLLPVLNFTASPQGKEKEWRDTLSRLGLHAAVSFDTVSPPHDGERRLYESLALLLNNIQSQLEQLIKTLEHHRQLRQQNAAKIIAELLIDAAAYNRFIPSDSKKELIVEQLHNDLRQHEEKTINLLLKIYRFQNTETTTESFPLLQGRFEDDLFSQEALKQMGVRLGLGFATGAATGAGLDLMTGGLTLGAGTTIGALVGGISQSIRHYGPQLLGKLQGGHKLSVDDAILRLLALRLQKLQQALEIRGHAAQSSLSLSLPNEDVWRKGSLPQPLLNARIHPEWSSLNKENQLQSSQRASAIEELTHLLIDQVPLNEHFHVGEIYEDKQG